MQLAASVMRAGRPVATARALPQRTGRPNALPCVARAGFGESPPKKKSPPKGRKGGKRGGSSDVPDIATELAGPSTDTPADLSRFTELESIYDNPEFYDMAFSYRNFEAEADFMYDVFEQTHNGQSPEVFVELGCGPAQHCMEMAESEMQVYGLDMNAAMLEYASEVANSDGLDVTLLEADMKDWDLPEGQKADIVAVLLGTLSHCTTNAEVMEVFASAERNLAPGGLLFLELVHPALLFNGSVTASGDTWTIDLEGGDQVEVWWGSESDVFDPISQVVQHTVQIDVNCKGELFRIQETSPQRQFTFQEIDLMAEASGLFIYAGFGEMDMEVPLDDEEPHRMVLVLQKPADDGES